MNKWQTNYFTRILFQQIFFPTNIKIVWFYDVLQLYSCRGGWNTIGPNMNFKLHNKLWYFTTK